MASHPEGIEMKHYPEASKLDPGPLKTLLHKFGLEKQYPNKLTLRSLLEINKDSISDEPVDSLKAVPWYFLKKLLIVNAKCRSCACLPVDESSIELDSDDNTEDNEVNLLDLITALFLCADRFLQQEMALKMSMCQFAVPLLLPQGTGTQSTLMLWALRGILKEWRPHSLSESKGFEEGNIVLLQMPLISFVRLQACSMSKSQLLNHVLSIDQQNHNIFAHKDMDGGAAPRTISDGLVEACWYLPCGNRNGDHFPEPLTVANLRGDICASQAQFRFLTQVSTAIFVFLDSVDEDERKLLLSLGDMGSKLFLVVISKGEVSRNVRTSLKEIMDAFKLKSNKLLMRRPNVNLARFSHQLTKAMKDMLKESTSKISIESMSNKAIDLGSSVDECKTEASKSAAEEILKGIGNQSIVDYKRNQLPLQGEHWKQLAKLEKEECRLKYFRGNRLEEYKAKLQKNQLNIRREQSKYKTTKAMARFLGFLATTDKEEKALFLKWLQLKLDMRSRKDLASLQNRFKERSLVNQDNKCLEVLDQCLLDSSLGIEHFMREMGQIYEASRLGNPKASAEHCPLPALAAELLLDGYPFELLDGDASNIPEKWVTDVLMELHRKVGEKSKLLVLTVLGVQSTGKSTLLNTMFGVQFPVSSGRCTRGAFMLFLRVGEDMRKDLSCDFILLIDTEGLKSPALAQLDESCERDNELATLVIGLSDITIINIAMENSTEMNEVLQIAVHAFLRMKEVGKIPVCYFVHQNVAGVSAHNVTDRKYILDRLNKMTQIAAEMEKRPSELLEKDDFQTFVKYFQTYEIYVKDLICQHIKECFSAELSFVMLKNKRLKEIIQKIKEAIEKASQPLPNDTTSVTEFLKNLCKYLVKDISISMDAVDGVLFQITTTCDPFTTSLQESLSDLKQQMEDEFSKSTDVIESLYTLPIKPLDELFKRVSGCAKQCPFCKMQCDAGDWNIQPDSTDEASDYWKYVLVTYNDRLAVKHNAKPAVIPEAWKSITKAQALEGLKVAFSIKQ
ncbi:up-regulator of cell proliferation [Coregonus clupeaformis]|uniref:up-regulator of cell proliferation n=1 Tax=Coregonus clupeaformis TaxID=59861 RepID=UPI001BE00CC5|nr:up-regulator of cell proliferation [Coregonus clupeaformis]